MKRELTRDLLTIFTDKVWVCFKWGEQFEQVYGQWCLVCKWVREFWAITHNTYLGRPFCRDNKAFTDLKGLHRAFFTRSNMSCQTHICYHYDVYKFKCEADNLPMNNRCILWDLWKKMQTKSGGLSTQTTLDHVVQVSKGPKEFSRNALLHALAQLVACDDQVSERGGGSESTENYSHSPQAFALVSKAVFWYCLTVMHSKTRTKKLPSCHNVTAYFHNTFIKFITEMRQAIEVSPWFDQRNHALTFTIRMPLVRSQSQPIHGPPTQQRLATGSK